MAHGVYAEVNAMQPPAFDPSLDRGQTEPKFEQLAVGDHAMLSRRYCRDSLVDPAPFAIHP